MNEARRLLEEVMEGLPNHLPPPPYCREDKLCLYCRARAFVPEPAAREAALVGALRAFVVKWPAGRVSVEDKRKADAVLAGTSPAAAALLAQGETVERAARPLFALARDSAGTCRSCGVPAPVKHDPQCVWSVFRAALAPGEPA